MRLQGWGWLTALPRAEVPLMPGARSGTGARVVRQISRHWRGKVSRLTRENLAFLN